MDSSRSTFSSHPSSLSPPHVIHVVPSLDHGGLERLVVDWTNARNRRHAGSTEVVCLDKLGDLSSLVEGGHVSCLSADRSRFPWDREAVRKLRGLLLGGTTKHAEHAKRESCAAARHAFPFRVFRMFRSSPIVHSHNLAAQQYAALASFGRRIPHVHTEHGSKEHTSGWKNRVRNRLLAQITGRVVAVSDAVCESMVEKEGVPRRLIAVIPNGIASGEKPSEDKIAAMRDELGILHDAAVIGTVGRLAEVKGQDRLIRAFAALTKAQGSRPKAQGSSGASRSTWLLFVGDGPARGALERQACDLGIADCVVFAGYREDARELISVMDLFVLPSRSEGLPVALLEAMAAGVPVMATDAGESWAVIEDGECGVKLPDDEDLWSTLICGQLDLVARLRQRLRRGLRFAPRGQRPEVGGRVEKAKWRVAEHYSLEATLDAYEQVYGVLT